MTDVPIEETERAIRKSVETMAESIPRDTSCAILAVELIDTMGERDDKRKLVIMAATLACALKMIAEQSA